MSKEDEKNPDIKGKEETSTEIVFSHGFGGVLLISLATYSPTASAGSAVAGPCGKHYT